MAVDALHIVTIWMVILRHADGLMSILMQYSKLWTLNNNGMSMALWEIYWLVQCIFTYSVH